MTRPDRDRAAAVGVRDVYPWMRAREAGDVGELGRHSSGGGRDRERGARSEARMLMARVLPRVLPTVTATLTV
jgi:hypothetical protein